ncbi:MAG: FHA domain-containing protein [Desulfamplus sp.]|nr:FHA domain-containing protein [Desulfamplus sp.]
MQNQKERKFTIGRSRECDIVLADESVSRKHAELIFMPDGKLFLIDCRSTHGTLLINAGKSQSVKQEFISPTDVVRFGDVTMPVKEILEGIHLKFKSFNTQAAQPKPSSEPPPQPQKPWVKGERLIRCGCGAVKPKNAKCQECGQ